MLFLWYCSCCKQLYFAKSELGESMMLFQRQFLGIQKIYQAKFSHTQFEALTVTLVKFISYNVLTLF